MKLRTKYWLGGLLLLTSSLATAADTCLEQKLIDDIKSKIQIVTEDMARFDRCKNDTNAYKVFEALSIVRTIQFMESGLNKPFNQNILPTDFWDYFSTRASLISEEKTCPTSVLAFVMGSRDDGEVHLCPDFYRPTISSFERAETMLHEVRHFAGYTHVTCARGPRNGDTGACDETIEENGSYAVTVESLTKMSLIAQNISRAERGMLKVLSLTYANEVFNAPIQARDLAAFYLVDQDHHGYMFSDKGLVQVNAIENATLISRASSLAVFPNDKSDALTVDVFSKALSASPPMGNFSVKYNALAPADRPAVVDIMNLDYLSCAVTGRYVEGDLRAGNNDNRIELPWIAKAAFSGAEIGVPDSDSVYLLNEENHLFRLKFLAAQQTNLTEVDAGAISGYRRLMLFNGQRLGLNEDGRVLFYDGGEWKPFKGLEGLRFTAMSRPFLWDEYFEETTKIALP